MVQGSIPAPAGETWQREWVFWIGGVHPRACGGNEEVSSLDVYRRGPSPRLRGKRARSGVWPSSRRSIPAPAGETESGKLRQLHD